MIDPITEALYWGDWDALVRARRSQGAESAVTADVDAIRRERWTHPDDGLIHPHPYEESPRTEWLCWCGNWELYWMHV